MKYISALLLSLGIASTPAHALDVQEICSGASEFATGITKLRDWGEPENNLYMELVKSRKIDNDLKGYYRNIIELIYNDVDFYGTSPEQVGLEFYLGCLEGLKNAKH